MKLYYTPGSCSLSPHIVLREAGLPFTLVRADMRSKKLADGSDYYAVNAKGYVPLLELDDGQRLGEGLAIVQYLADLVPQKRLAPAAGTMERYRLVEWLAFISTELHKGFSPLFNAAMPEEAKAMFRAKLVERLRWVDEQLEGREWLTGSQFTVADAYLFTIASWAGYTGVDISGLKRLTAYLDRVRARPAVQAALRAEGLQKD